MSGNSPDSFDYFLDITDDVCPLTFVKTKLLIDAEEPGGSVYILRLRKA